MIINGRKTKLVYLAGPIRSVTQDEAKGWRHIVSTKLYYAGLASFNPAAAWSVPNHHTNGQNDPVLESHLQVANDTAVAFSDFVVVGYAGVASLGTDREIELALSLNKPMAIYWLTYEWRSPSGRMIDPDVEGPEVAAWKAMSDWREERGLDGYSMFTRGQETQLTSMITYQLEGK